MSDIFEPGETAIWQNLAAPDDAWNGTECFVISGMQWGSIEDRYTSETHYGLFYEVRDEEGEWAAAPWELKKILPPPIDTVELVAALYDLI